MPRKQRQPKARPRDPLAPALQYYLMVGDHAPARLHGWGWLGLISVDEVEAVVAAAWADHADGLIAEAALAGFVPWGLRQRRPRGEAVERWRAAFINVHRY